MMRCSTQRPHSSTPSPSTSVHWLSMQNYVMTWLHDSATDVEQLHLVFPQSDGLVIKCDLQECVLNTLLLPYYHCFNMSTGDTVLPARPLSASSVSTATCRTSTNDVVCRLEVVARLPADSVCQSVVFGNPVVARPTSCWKIDWDELETNQKQFHALTSLLSRQGMVLIARLMTVTETASGYVGRRRSAAVSSTPSQPRGHYVIMPSLGVSLLIKSVAVSELLLPTVDLPPAADVHCLDVVDTALRQVECLDSYNPLTMSCGLFDCLMSQLGKQVPVRRSSAGPQATGGGTCVRGVGTSSDSHQLPAAKRARAPRTFPNKL